MSIQVYYFSGTGNSYAVAKDIAGKVKADLISIPKVMERDKIYSDAGSIGIIFPSYLAVISGVPLIVGRFVKKIADIESKYIFAACTCGGYENVNAVPSLNKLKQIIKACGGKLSAQYSVRLPMNNLNYAHIPIPITRNHDAIISQSKNRVEEICDHILQRKTARHKAATTAVNFLMTPVYKMMWPAVIKNLREKAQEPADSKLRYCELVPLTDKSIVWDSTQCTSCGTCAKVCPARNIEMVNKIPLWRHQCEMCFACDEWCPANAIQHWGRAKGVKYHHPVVKVTDMF